MEVFDFCPRNRPTGEKPGQIRPNGLWMISVTAGHT